MRAFAILVKIIVALQHGRYLYPYPVLQAGMPLLRLPFFDLDEKAQ
jgi:hypothetical protein